MTTDQGDNRRTRDGRGRYIRDAGTAETDAKACELRQLGYSYQRIADELGLSHRDLARRAVERALRATVSEPADELRALELMRLDEALRHAWGVLKATHYVVSRSGKVVVHPVTGELLHDDAPVLQAIDRILRISERRAKLLGLDAPVAFVTPDLVDLEIARLSRLLGIGQGVNR